MFRVNMTYIYAGLVISPCPIELCFDGKSEIEHMIWGPARSSHVPNDRIPYITNFSHLKLNIWQLSTTVKMRNFTYLEHLTALNNLSDKKVVRMMTLLLHQLIEAAWRMYASAKLGQILSYNGLSPAQLLSITWTNDDLRSIGPLGKKNFKYFHWRKWV